MAGKRYVFLSYGRKDVYPKGTTNAVEQAQHFTVVEKVYHHLYGLRGTEGFVVGQTHIKPQELENKGL